MSLPRLLVCVTGVYSTFLLWAIAQERLSQPFPSTITHHHHHEPAHVSPHQRGTSTGDKIPSATVVNVLQSLASCLSAVGYLLVKEWSRRGARSSGTKPTDRHGASAQGGASEEKSLWELVGWDELFTRKKAGQGLSHAKVAPKEKVATDEKRAFSSALSNGDSNGTSNDRVLVDGMRNEVESRNKNGHLTPRTYISSSTNTGSVAPSRSPSPLPHARVGTAGSTTDLSLVPVSSFPTLSSLLRPTPLSLLLRISLLQTLTPLFAHASLSYISFPTLILGKSCKLLPVMGMNVLVYRRKFKAYKYGVVGMVSAGIGLFMLCGKGKGKGGQGDSAWGMGLLGISLVIDGLTNSTQDELFALHPSFSGQALMFNMSFFSLCMTLPVILVPSHLPGMILRGLIVALRIPTDVLAPLGLDKTAHLLSSSTLSPPLIQTIHFVSTHPSSLLPIVPFALLGGLGQLFIFETISRFGSLTLVMLTVTRKLVTMLLSVMIFGHVLEVGQWIGVAVVFAGIGLEAGMKRREIMDKRSADEKRKPKLKTL